MANAAELMLLFKGNATDLDGKIGGVKGTLGSLGGAAMGASKVISGGMLAGGAAIAGLGIASIQAAGDFQTQMKQVETLGADFGKPFAEVEQDVSKLASSMGIDATNAATTLYNAVSAGVPAGNALEFMEAAAKAAVGGAADLDAVGSALSVTMNSWGESAGGATSIADGLFQVVKMGVTTMPELASNIGAVSGIAAAAGVSFEETGAALAQITTKGKTTSVASTQLKGILAEMMTPTSKATAAFKEMGYANSQAAVDALGFQGALNALGDAAEAGGNPITAMFGSVEAGGAALDLTGDNAQAFSDKLSGMGAAAGNSEAALGKVNEGFQRQVDLVKGQVSGVLRDVGMALLPSVTDAMKSVSGALQGVDWQPIIDKVSVFAAVVGDKIAAFDWAGLMTTVGGVFTKIGDVIGWLGEHPGIAKFLGVGALVVAAIAPIAAIIGPLLPIVGALGSVIGAVAGALPLLGAALAVITGPVGLVVAAVVGLIAIGVLLYKNWDEIKAAAAALWEKIKEAWDGLMNTIKTNADLITNVLLALAGPLGWLVLIWKEKGDEIMAKMQEIKDWISTKWEEIKATITTKLSEIWEAIRLKWDAFLREISEKLSAILGAVTQKWDEIKTTIGDKLEAIRTSIGEKWEAIKALVWEKLEAIARTVSDWCQALWDSINAAWENYKTLIHGALVKIYGVVADILGQIEGIFGLKLDAIRMFVDSALGLIQGIFTGDMGLIKEAVSRILDQIVGFFADLGARVQSKIGDLFQIGSDWIQGLWDGIAGTWDRLMDWFGKILGDPISLAKKILGIGSPSRVFMKIGAQTAEGYFAGFEQWFGKDAPRMSGLLRKWVGQWSEDLDGGGQGVDLNRLPSWAAWKLPLWMLRGKAPPGGGPSIGPDDITKIPDLLKPPGPDMSIAPVPQRGYTVWNPPGTQRVPGPGLGIGGGGSNPPIGSEPGKPLYAEGEFELTGRPIIRIAFGKRELEIMADELVAIIEAKLKLASSAGTV